MIQFALLFGLGFLSATLLALLVAPAIHRRIVRYTERRIEATLPISSQEVRAQRDMARAVYAAENARSQQDLLRERERSTSLQLRADALADQLKGLQAEKSELTMQIAHLDVEASEVRSRLREEGSYIEQLKAALQKAEEVEASQALEMDTLRQQLLRLTSDADNFRIDLSARDTEVENLRLRVTTLRDEREALRNDIRIQTNRVKDLEIRLAQEEQRSARLDERLAREIADRADKETALERRVEEIARLRSKLNGDIVVADGDGQAHGSARSAHDFELSGAGREAVSAEDDDGPLASEGRTEQESERSETGLNASMLAEEARNRATALTERLLNSKNTNNDEALRGELAAIAASMIAVTATAEGKTSPIHTVLSGKTGSVDRESLAARSKKVLASLTSTAS